MKQIVLDSSAVILLSKCGLLEKARSSFEWVAPASIIQETASKELAGKYPDAAFVRELVSRRLLRIEKPSSTKVRIPLSLHRGEKEALLLTLSLPGSVLATDDGKAIKAARLLKVPFVTTPRIVVALFRLGRISLDKVQSDEILKAEAFLFYLHPVIKVNLGFFTQRAGQSTREWRHTEQVKELLKNKNPITNRLKRNAHLFFKRVDGERTS